MTSLIIELIDKRDSSEIIRDQIAAILVVESARQQALAAAAAGKDPKQWKLRVFLERSNPISEWVDCPDPIDDPSPIISVRLDRVDYDMRASNVVERQKATGIFHLDCYGYGVSSSDGGEGHEPGDMRGALEAQRAARLVRNILCAGAYTYLGLRGVVWRRWPQSIQMLQPPAEERSVQHIGAARFELQVEFNEFSTQVEGELLELISVTVLRRETGEIYLTAQYGDPSP